MIVNIDKNRLREFLASFEDAEEVGKDEYTVDLYDTEPALSMDIGLGESEADDISLPDSAEPAPLPMGAPPEDLINRLKRTDEGFSETLLRLIDEREMTDTECYKRANIDRKLFSSIKCKKNYRPTKKTAVAFAIALELDLPTTLDLLARAGITFSPTDKFDLIISFFVTHRIYDMMQINSVLFDYDQPLLGV